jgi:phosphopantetheinyl transferase
MGRMGTMGGTANHHTVNGTRASNGVEISCVYLPRPLSAATRMRLRAQLPYGRRLRASTSPRRQSQSLVAVALACELLTRVMQRPLRPAQLRYTALGKPYAPGFPEFSISHSGAWVVCALAGVGKIGIDVETVPVDSRRAALATWTAKEATLKAAGARLQDLPQVQLRGSQLHFQDRRWYCRTPKLSVDTVLRVVSSVPITRLRLRRIAAGRVVAWQEALG